MQFSIAFCMFASVRSVTAFGMVPIEKYPSGSEMIPREWMRFSWPKFCRYIPLLDLPQCRPHWKRLFFWLDRTISLLETTTHVRFFGRFIEFNERSLSRVFGRVSIVKRTSAESLATKLINYTFTVQAAQSLRPTAESKTPNPARINHRLSSDLKRLQSKAFKGLFFLLQFGSANNYLTLIPGKLK